VEILKYKGYEGTAEIDMSRNLCRGKILFIKDLVTYQAETPADLERQFREAIDDYRETCKDLGRAPAKPFKGQFNVRIAPELHRAASLRAAELSVSLNDVIVKALDSYLCISSEVNNTFNISISESIPKVATVSSSTSDELHWTAKDAGAYATH
jgi:predicted HicB family RNase H-like nuclease